MRKANWILKDNNIYSLDFNDFYYNIKNPLKERNGIYVENAFKDAKESLTILELGFGLGINFALCAKKAKEKNIKLHYVAIEKYYHEINDLKISLNEFKLVFHPDFIANYPPCRNGIYRISYENITIDLVFEDVNKALDDLDFEVDIVFADGFSPNKNEEMFSENTLIKITKFLKYNSKLLSYSSNASFKKSLTKLGFKIESINLEIKRESTLAIYQKNKNDEQIDGYFTKQHLNAEKIAIIGGGIAGACVAYELAKIGKNISVFEKNELLANEGSGNKIGLLSALIQNPNSLLGEFSEFSYWHSSKFYKKLGINLDGVLEHAFNDELRKRFAMQTKNPLFKIINNFAFLKDGGALKPYELVPMVFELSKVKIFLNHSLFSYKMFENRVDLEFQNGFKDSFDAVIFATGANSKELFANLPLSRMRGQVTWLKNELKYKHSISSKAYLTTARDNMLVLGATYDRNLIMTNRTSDDERNINNFKEIFGQDLSHLIIGSRVGYRCYSSDRFPVVGAFYNDDIFKNLYKSLHFTKKKLQKIPPKSRIFLSTAHGSRGLASALTSARLIASYFSNTPSGMFKRYEHALNPSRFLIRKLKKGI